MENKNKLPIAIIGAGPIGLAAAAQLSEKEQSFVLFESGNQIADSIRSWQHVPMFSPWEYNLEPAAVKILSRYNWQKPEPNALPTGKELIELYLEQLAETNEIKPYIRLNSKVLSVMTTTKRCCS